MSSPWSPHETTFYEEIGLPDVPSRSRIGRPETPGYPPSAWNQRASSERVDSRHTSSTPPRLPSTPQAVSDDSSPRGFLCPLSLQRLDGAGSPQHSEIVPEPPTSPHDPTARGVEAHDQRREHRHSVSRSNRPTALPSRAILPSPASTRLQCERLLTHRRAPDSKPSDGPVSPIECHVPGSTYCHPTNLSLSTSLRATGAIREVLHVFHPGLYRQNWGTLGDYDATVVDRSWLAHSALAPERQVRDTHHVQSALAGGQKGSPAVAHP